MVSRIFKTALLVLFLLLNGCENSPTGPVAGTDTEPTLAQSSFLPLEEGACWKYSLYYSNGWCGSSAGPYGQNKEYGYFQLDVVKEQTTDIGKTFELRFNLVIDSLYYSYNHDMHTSLPHDTAYTTCNVLDTVFTRTVALINDTLWLAGNDSLEYMMPSEISEKSTVSLTLFNISRSADLKY